MTNKSTLYLKNNVKFEPTVFRWPAWPQIIPPVTAGLNLKNRYLKILESYLEDPDVHYIAANDPNLIGGPFINVPSERRELVKATYERIKEDAKELIRLADSFHELNELILSKAKGQGIEPLYTELPSMLRGKVELFYDLNNLPRYRLIEPLFYRHYYKLHHQSVIVANVNEDFRPFVLSTPYTLNEGEIEIDRPFNDVLYDTLFNSRTTAISRDQVAEIFQTNQIEGIVNNFFQENPTHLHKHQPVEGSGFRMRYFGHACILIETKDVSILVDPLVSYDYSTNLNRFTFSDLPDKVDYVLFTHAHEDHIVFETILQIRHKVGSFVLPRDRQGSLSDPSLRLIFKNMGFKNVVSLEEFEILPFKGGEIIGLPFLGEHCDVEVNSKLGFCVNVNGHKILFLADSNNVEPQLYNLIFDEIGPIDTVFIGMEHEGGPLTFQYGSLITIPISYAIDQSRRLSGSDYSKAINVIEQARCKNAYVYAMGQEPWLNHLMALNYNQESPQIIHSKKFVNECKTRGINSELLFSKREWQF